MRKLIKQWLCQHIYSIEKEVYLHDTGILYDGSVFYSTARVFAVYSTCLKCGKETIDESRRKRSHFFRVEL